jgi:hypothetical protein
MIWIERQRQSCAAAVPWLQKQRTLYDLDNSAYLYEDA